MKKEIGDFLCVYNYIYKFYVIYILLFTYTDEYILVIITIANTFEHLA